MTEWIRTAGKAITPNFQMAFTYVGQSGIGYMFDYDPATKQVECKSDIARENYEKCLAAVEAGTMTAQVEDFSAEFWDAGAIRCHCGAKVELSDDWRGTRCKCGSEYSSTGQQLRANWREICRETGELTDDDFLS